MKMPRLTSARATGKRREGIIILELPAIKAIIPLIPRH